MSELFQDLRYAARMLRNNLGFSIVAVVTLALGIGVNTAIFSVVDAVLLRPLPFEQPGQLIRLFETEAQPGSYPFTGPDFLDWKTKNHTIQDMALFNWTQNFNLSGEGTPDNITGIRTEANFFSLLGARALLGRTFAPDEDQPGKERVVILSYALWQRQFGADPKILGRTIQLDGQTQTVIGVMPPSFRYPAVAQLWAPLLMDSASLGRRGSHSFNAIGRLKPGVSLEAAQADLSVIAAQLEKEFPQSNFKVGAKIVALHDNIVGKSAASLTIMMWAVALVLLIACANVANLLLSRAVARQREMGIRAALGAQRFRLVRQLLTESVLLAVAGGLLGIGVAELCMIAIANMKNFGLPNVNALGLNGTVLVFTFAISVLTGIVFGIVPALHTSRADVFDELKGGAGGVVSHGRGRRFASDALVVAEIGLALLLLTSAGLLLKDFQRLRNTRIGVRTEGVLTAAISLPKAKYVDQRQQFIFEQRIRESLSQIPGVDAVAVTSVLPLEGGSNSYINLRGQPFQPMSGPLVETHNVTPGYFRVMGIPLLKGRDFTEPEMAEELERDAKSREIFKKAGNNPPPAEDTNTIVYPTIVNETMVRTFWPNQDPIGKLWAQGSANGPWRQVIGVVGDVKQWGLTQPPIPEGYTIADGGQGQIYVLHGSLPKETLAAELRRAVAQIDNSLPIYSVRTMDEVIEDQAVSERLLTTLVGIFSGLALLLAAVGIYGVLSYVVTQRTREIGIRISLGASRGRVLGLMLKQGLRLTAIGLAAGVIASIAVAKVLSSVLHGVSPRDPFILAATTATLLAVAFLACYLPARRATKVDPLVALRYE
jgi:putative ABC transport system permease protein